MQDKCFANRYQSRPRGSTLTQSMVMVSGFFQLARPAQGICRRPKMMRAGRSGTASSIVCWWMPSMEKRTSAVSHSMV